MLNSNKHEILHAHNGKMPTIVGILNIIYLHDKCNVWAFKARKFFIFRYFSFYKQLKFMLD